MANKALAKFHEFNISAAELKSLDPEEAGFISVTAFAVSESNALMRLYLHTYSGEASDLNSAMSSCNMVLISLILRTWSSKLFEYKKLLSMNESYHKSSSDKVKDICADAWKRFEEIEMLPDRDLMRILRDEVSSHYSLKAATKNVPHVSDSSNLTLYMHDLSGNSFYPMGDEVVFWGRLRRQAHINSKSLAEIVKEWSDWNTSASVLLDEIFAEAAERILLRKFPTKNGRTCTYWIDPKLVADPDVECLPLLVRLDEREKRRITS